MNVRSWRIGSPPGAAPRRATLPVVAAGRLVLGLALAGCGAEAAADPETRRTPARGDDVPEVLATVGDERVTMDDVRARIGDQLDQLDTQYRLARHRAVEQTLDALLRERLIGEEAEARGRSPDEILAAELGQPLTPTDEEVGAWFVANRDRIGGRSLDEVRSQIADHLGAERRRTAVERLDRRLRSERGVHVHLETFRLALDDEGAPSSGPGDAPVTLVEFSDFQCPYCRGFAPNLRRLQQEFGDRLRIVYRQFPLGNIHPDAFKAAEASLCAHEQGRFWAFHDLVFDEQERVTVRDLKEKARRVGLDGGDFDRCLDSGRYVERVQEDVREGTRVGVDGTPALFLNGVPIDGGAVPYETVAAAIRRELERAER